MTKYRLHRPSSTSHLRHQDAARLITDLQPPRGKKCQQLSNTLLMHNRKRGGYWILDRFPPFAFFIAITNSLSAPLGAFCLRQAFTYSVNFPCKWQKSYFELKIKYSCSRHKCNAKTLCFRTIIMILFHCKRGGATSMLQLYY